MGRWAGMMSELASIFLSLYLSFCFTGKISVLGDVGLTKPQIRAYVPGLLKLLPASSTRTTLGHRNLRVLNTRGKVGLCQRFANGHVKDGSRKLPA
jgi:hypothetical protein